VHPDLNRERNQCLFLKAFARIGLAGFAPLGGDMFLDLRAGPFGLRSEERNGPCC